MSDKKPDSRKKNKELVDRAAERLAEILITQIELNRKNKRNLEIIKRER